MIYNALQSKKLSDDARLLLQETRTLLDEDTFATHEFTAFLTNKYLPILADVHFFEAVWKFEELFPIGRKVKKNRYIEQHLQKLEHFF